MTKLTEEQQLVVHHPLDHHARVLAVAGSGKSTTMAHPASVVPKAAAVISDPMVAAR